MELSRLPNSSTDKPAMLACFDSEKLKVSWALDGQDFYDCERFMDGTNWFQVWKRNDVIHVQATQWYHPRGDFCMRITDVTPEQAVALADKTAFFANEMIDGNTGLKGLS